MTCDDIISMAREAGWHDDLLGVSFTAPLLERLAAIAAAEKEAQMIRDGWRKCAKGQRTTQFCGLLEEAVEGEREACAKLCDGWMHANGNDCAEAIRARGEQEQPR